MKTGKELRVLYKIHGSLFSIIRYEVYETPLSDVYPVNPAQPSAEHLATERWNEDTNSESGFEINKNDSNTPTEIVHSTRNQMHIERPALPRPRGEEWDRE